MVYAAVIAGCVALHYATRRTRVPAAPLALVAGLAMGRAGTQWATPELLSGLLGPVLVHLGFLLGALGVALGQGVLRLSVPEVLRRSVRPVALAVFGLLVGVAALPVLLADLEPERTFRRFLLPLAFTFTAFPLLTVRDLRRPPTKDVGATLLVATTLVGAVYCWAPTLLWRAHLDAKVLWKEPVLVLGESGAFGVAGAVAFLWLTRKWRWPRLAVGTAALAALMALAFRYALWPPFVALGFGVILGRAGEARLPVPFAGREGAFSELPFLVAAGMAFAPDLWVESLVGPSLLHAMYLAAILVVVRWRVDRGKELVTGPGLLFLGLALAVRLDKRMGPLMRATMDFAVPAWVVIRGGWAVVDAAREARHRGRDAP